MDLSYYSLKVLSWVGVVKDLRTPSDAVRNAHLRYPPEQRAALNAGTSYWGWGKQGAQAAGEKVRGALSAAKDAAHAASESLPSVGAARQLEQQP